MLHKEHPEIVLHSVQQSRCQRGPGLGPLAKAQLRRRQLDAGLQAHQPVVHGLAPAQQALAVGDHLHVLPLRQPDLLLDEGHHGAAGSKEAHLG